jgi:hypothetical protein
MNRPQLSIIIVHWNTPELLEECLKSIVEFEKELNYEIIVIDNNSTYPVTAIELKFPEDNFRFVGLKENIGFGKACNYSVGLSKADTLLFLGPDARLIKEGTLLRMYSKFKAIPEVGTFSCSLVNSDGSPQKHYFNFPEVRKIIREWWFEVLNHIPLVYQRRQRQPLKKLEEVDMVIAHCLMVSKKIFYEAGAFPEDTFMFGDDIEINKRVQKSGYHNYLYRGEQMVHHSGQAGVIVRYGARRVHIIQDSIFRFNRTHYGFIYAIFTTTLLMIRALLNILILSPLYVKGGFREYFWNNWIIIWHYLAYQWRPGAIRQIAGA